MVAALAVALIAGLLTASLRPAPAAGRAASGGARPPQGPAQPDPGGADRPGQPRSGPPLALLTFLPDAARGKARAIALVADGPAGSDTDSYWPDSSSPVRNAPSNATTGPARAVLPRFPGWNLSKVDLATGGRQRYFLVARPTVVTEPNLPLLLVLPGRDMTPATIARASGFLKLVGQAVVVYPAGFANSWNAGYCCGVAHLAGVNDVAFLEAVIRTVLATQPGTSARAVYIAGFSNGGRMALDMACADPGAFAGVAAVEAVSVAPCLRTRPVPLLDVASTGDPLITVAADAPPKHIAGHAEITVAALVDRWRALDACGPAATSTAYSIMTFSQWTACGGGGRVGLSVYRGGRHAWPHGAPGTPPAQRVIWDFFHGTTPGATSDVPHPA